MATFNAAEVAARVQHRLWAYLSAHAYPADIPAVAERLFSLEPGDVRRLAAVHVAVSHETALMLEAVPGRLRERPSSVTRTQTETRGRIVPPVDWATTLRRRRES